MLQKGTIFHASLQNHQTNKRLHTGRQHTDTDTHTCTFFHTCMAKTCTSQAMLIHNPWTACPGAIKQCITGSLLRACHCSITLLLGINYNYLCLVTIFTKSLRVYTSLEHLQNGASSSPGLMGLFCKRCVQIGNIPALKNSGWAKSHNQVPQPPPTMKPHRNNLT